ncbi:MAG TPA: M13 family metallopeptidase [Steroidobacteraceae bacterium]|jgi:putative endopeptidase|nr:M13 family metallopeptidase [Steroidobacteraceae bacterium]
MRKALGQLLAAAATLTACVNSADAASVLQSGVDLGARDLRVRPGDDFFQYALGSWYALTAVPPDQSEVGVDTDVSARVRAQLRTLIEDSAKTPTAIGNQIGELYKSFMNENHIESLDATPLQADLGRIAKITDKDEFVALMASSPMNFGTSLFSLRIEPDAKSPVNALYIGQAGLGLDDPESYLSPGAAAQRDAYRDFITRTLMLVDYADPKANAAAIVRFETDIAKVSWSQTRRRDIAATYNPTTLVALEAGAPGVAWQLFLNRSGVPGAAPIVVAEKSAVIAIADLYAQASLDVLKAWQTFHTIDNAARFLSKRFIENRFSFHGSVMTGATQLPARWKRGVNLVNAQLGMALGRLYVTANFSPSAKEQMQVLVESLRKAMAQRIQSLDWMSEPTKREALAKLAAMRVFVGYPARWRDYSGLKIARDDLYGNIQRSMAFDWSFQCATLGKLLDKDAWGPFDWGITPQTVDAFNIASENLIIFPAAILQPPFFNPNADAAHNYGAIGAVIGHEITHGFDDQGRKIDATGKLRNWWSPIDSKGFEQRAAQLARQYDGIEVLPGVHVNGSQTLGENIADLGGVVLALDAYRAHLEGSPAPLLDGLTGDQRVFFGWAQRWRRKMREDALRDQVNMNVHAPATARTNAPLRDIDAWYAAFDIRTTDRNFLPPDQRVRIW